MAKKSRKHEVKFWPIFGIATGCALVLTLVYTFIIPGLTLENWSNSMCVSALLIGSVSIIPVFVDAGRGVIMAGKFSPKKDEQKDALNQERKKREVGMTITFALGAATVIIGLISVILSLV